ncbi:MAG: hypothetical protein KF799_10945 [Bdellovibrionales bacterium]|nr:hypothetical protein [Bdellovibrionales bacterium]
MKTTLSLALVLAFGSFSPAVLAAPSSNDDKCERHLNPSSRGFKLVDGNGRAYVLKRGDLVGLKTIKQVPGWPRIVKGQISKIEKSTIIVDHRFHVPWKSVRASMSFVIPLEDLEVKPFAPIRPALTRLVAESLLLGSEDEDEATIVRREAEIPNDLRFELGIGLLVSEADVTEAVELLNIAAHSRHAQELVDLFENSWLVEHMSGHMKWGDVYGYTDVEKDPEKFQMLEVTLGMVSRSLH